MKIRYTAAFEAKMEILESELHKFSSFVEEKLPDSPHAYGLNLAFEEIGTNIVKYGCVDTDLCQIEVELVSDADGCTLRVVDDSAPFNPLEEAPEADTTQAAMDREVGGLGIMLVKRLTKEMSYDYQDKKNQLTCRF